MEPGNLESRVSALEHQVRDLSGRVQASEQDAAAARVLAGAADRDVGALSGELRDFRSDTAANFAALRSSTTASFNAIREDFVDLRSHMDQGFAKVNQEFAKIDQEFAKVHQEFAKVDRGILTE
jgi:predicted  nucleic acid-binding Zn-ribbon protein